MTAANLLRYYEKTPYEIAAEERERAEFIAKSRNASKILAGEFDPTPKLDGAKPTKGDFRLSPAEVSEQAEAMIRGKAKEAFAALEKVMKWANIPIQKGNGQVHSPRPDVPHFKETTVAAIQTGPNKFLIISMTNMPSDRVEVMPDGKLRYHGIKKPKDGDDPMNTSFPIRGVEKLPDGSFRADPAFTNKGMAWKSDDISEVSKAILKAAGKLPDPNKPRRTTEPKGPSMAAQDEAAMRAIRERQRQNPQAGRQAANGLGM
jgi:hypothetical protein